MIRAYCSALDGAKVGSGKTYGMVRDGLHRFRRLQMQVFSNMARLRFPEAIYIDDVEEISGLSNGLLLLDEASVCMTSRYWRDVSRDTLASLAQVRHNGLDLWFTTQHMARVDTVLRELVSEVVMCKRVGHFFLALTYTPDLKTVVKRRLYRFEPLVGALYDTAEIIGAHGGSVEIEQAVARRTIERKRLAADAQSKAVRTWPQADRYRLYRWSLNGARLTRAASEARTWLLRERLLEVGEASEREKVARELRRRHWLHQFGLTIDDVPNDCSFEHPWLRDYSPKAVRAYKEAMAVIEASKAVVKGSKGKLKVVEA